MGMIFDTLAKIGVVPVVAVEKTEHALPLADALLSSGISAIEVTFRTSVAAEVIQILARERPQLIVGAGTVLSSETLNEAICCGASFGVAPGLNPSIVNAAQTAGLPFIPGVATPSEIEQGLALGCKLLKFFPAETIGGARLLKAFAGPYSHTGVRFMPTGGISAENVGDYLSMPIVAAVGGTWIAKTADMNDGRWNDIAEKAKAAASLAQSFRR